MGTSVRLILLAVTESLSHFPATAPRGSASCGPIRRTPGSLVPEAVTCALFVTVLSPLATILT